MPVKSSKVKSQKSKVPASQRGEQVKTKKLVKKSVVKKAPVKIVLKAKAKKVEVFKAKVSLNASVFDTKGKVVGHVGLPAEIFGAKINDSLMSQAVRVYLANQRQGTVKTKNRGEVNATTKKMYAQKGTGRARHGSKRAPLFVGGGRAFGPRPRDLSLSLSKKMKTLALFSALSSKLKDQELKIIKGLETITPKTKIMAGVLKNLGIEEDNKVLLIMPKVGVESQSVSRAARNIEGIQILGANSINAYRVLDNRMVLLMSDSVDVLKDTFMKGEKE